MLLYLLLLFSLLAFLFVLSFKIPTAIYTLSFLLTRNKGFSVGIVAVFLLPGTIIHELSHFLLASVLRVPTGELTIFPTVEKDGEVKTGKLMLGKTDAFRRTLIGLSPLFLGLALIYIVGKIFFPDSLISNLLNTKYLIPNTLGIYLLFATSITMFSSSKDLETLWIAGPITFLLLASLYLTGLRISPEETLIRKIALFLTDLNYYLLITAIVNYLLFIFLSLSLFLWQKILGRKVYHERI